MMIALALAAQQGSDLDKRITEKPSATLKETGAASVSVALVKDGRLVFAKAFGNATAETRYAIGSISK
jgi:CubicO group peptidase (beta-lactamase class C family)